VYNLKHEKHIEILLNFDLMTMLLERLQHDSDSGAICSMCLTALSLLLERSENARRVFMKMGGDQVLEDLQVNPFYEVYRAAADMLEKYCGAKEMGEEDKQMFISQRKPEGF
jgi:hypothetical protein